ncbi:PLP-dependent aminotransferase family protein [Petroclostridium sp. X23]|uniref:MocR-like pyridoxine biosynthesis transcription factor PdxR n=1 Tax=Petroclostridium sp. X23 TaxID=3045146 RepID=UPI0024ACB1AA|nr:PLP-dependent aminotransferase family protein [Petroclostridium sp. X23]WHH58436.1 PLP-dependent aminotransferase family protein [Petroclostridium sp. X23]
MSNIVPIQLDKQSSVPLYIQLFEELKKMICEDQLQPGTRLPAIRKLAGQLNVNNVTVVNAYKLLEQHQYVFSKVGSGVYVSSVQEIEEPEEPAIEDHIIKDEFYDDEDIQLMSRGHITLNKNSINFASATPTPDLFPVDDFKIALVEVLERDKGQAFGYHESNGYRPLRHSISCFLDDYYSIDVSEDHIQIISGAQQGIDVIAKALIQPGDYVFVENPTYTGAIAVFKSRGARIIGIPIQEDGIDMELAEKYIRRYQPKIIYTMPNYQNPTTYCYSEKRKRQLLELAYKHHFYIIEDDFLTDLDFTQRHGPRTLKSLDRFDRVLYIKSFSKVLMPGLRIGFLITPPEIFQKILQAKHTTDISSSGLIQRAFDLYLRKGIWGSHLEYMKQIYKDRYQKMLDKIICLENIGVRIHKPNGGLNFWLTLPKNVSATKLYYECAKHDLLLIPGRIFYTSESNSNDSHIRISYAAVYPEQIEPGIDILYNCINKMLNKTDEPDIYYSPLI